MMNKKLISAGAGLALTLIVNRVLVYLFIYLPTSNYSVNSDGAYTAKSTTYDIIGFVGDPVETLQLRNNIILVITLICFIVFVVGAIVIISRKRAKKSRELENELQEMVDAHHKIMKTNSQKSK